MGPKTEFKNSYEIPLNLPPLPILVVDDEPDIVEFISYSLKSRGYLIATARDGVEDQEAYG